MNVTRNDPAPVVVPPPTFTIEMSEDEVLAVVGVLGAIGGPPAYLRSVLSAMYRELSRAARTDAPSARIALRKRGHAVERSLYIDKDMGF